MSVKPLSKYTQLRNLPEHAIVVKCQTMNINLPCSLTGGHLHAFMHPRLPYPFLRPKLHSFTNSTPLYIPSRFYSAAPIPAGLPIRISELRSRIGKCIIFGLKDEQIDEAGAILRDIAREWKGLVAGVEGFQVEGSGGMRRDINWGDMVSGQSWSSKRNPELL